jgi:hypothetical protein
MAGKAKDRAQIDSSRPVNFLSLASVTTSIQGQKPTRPSLVCAFICNFCQELTLTRNQDRDSFLPSAVQRYPQLFLPVLQLVNGILVALGPEQTTAAN